MSFNELFTGLQQNTVDGQENPPSLIYASRLQEVQKYLSVTEHVNNFLGFIIDKNFYDGLSQEQQQIVTEVYIDKLKESGMQVNTLTPEEKTAFKEALAPMYEKYKAEFGEEIFSMAEEYGQ